MAKVDSEDEEQAPLIQDPIASSIYGNVKESMNRENSIRSMMYGD